jgi:hypothetical protein
MKMAEELENKIVLPNQSGEISLPKMRHLAVF